MIQLSGNVSGKVTAPPVLILDENGHRYNMILEPPYRGYFLLNEEDPLTGEGPEPWGFTVLYGNEKARGVLVRFDENGNLVRLTPGAYELGSAPMSMTPNVLAFPLAGLPRVRPLGRDWVTDAGARYLRMGMTGFCDYKRFLDEGRAGVDAIWRQAVDLGARERRVLGHMTFITTFGTQTHGERWFDAQPDFFALAAEYGLRIAFDVFADMQAIGYPTAKMQDIWNRTARIQEPITNAFLGLGNELSKNGIKPEDFAYPGFPCSQGSATADAPPPMPGWGDRRWHGRRDDPKWQESSGDMGYVSMGLQYIDGKWIRIAPEAPATHDEPIGFAEVEIPNRRITDPQKARRIALEGLSHGAGIYFHAEDAIYSRWLGPIQQTCGRAFFDAAKE